MRAAPTASAAARARASISGEIGVCVEFSTRHATYIIGSMIANGIVYYLLYDTRYNYTLSAHFQASLIFDVSLHSHSPYTQDTCAHVGRPKGGGVNKQRTNS